MRAPVLLVVATALLLTGCGTGHEPDVRASVESWSDALDDGDWAAACELLSPDARDELEESARQPCAAALRDVVPTPGGAPEKVQVYGTQAQVSYAAETLFLAEYGDHWLVWAAGCTPTADDRPFDCQVSGG